MNKIISILCEGPHDVAFITKILKTNDFLNNEKLKLGEYPSPINDLLINEATNTKVEDLNIQEFRQSLIPSSTLQKGDDIFLFIYSLGGDSRKEARINYCKKLLNFIPQEDDEINPFPNIELSMIYFFDADEKGIACRLNELNKELNFLLEDEKFTKNAEVIIKNNMKFGCYVFADEGSDNGNLENIIIPLMKLENTEIFEDAEKYLDHHFVKDRCRNKFDKSKSIIGLCGQLQKSGSSNVVCISQSDYLSKEKIKADKTCLSIISFVESFTV